MKAKQFKYLFVALISLLGNQLYGNRPAESFVKKGIALIESHSEYSKAIMYLDSAIALDNKNALAYTYRGIAYNLTEQFGKAIVDLNRAILLDSSIDIAVFNRGFAHHSQGNYLFAIYDYNSFIAKHPNNSVSYFKRSLVHRELKEYKEELSDLNSCIKIDGKNTEYLLERSHCNYKLQNFKNAIADLSACIQLNPETVEYKIERALIYKELGDLTNCSTDLETVLVTDSMNTTALFELANCNLLLSKHWPAISLYSKLIHLNYNLDVVYYNRARAYIRIQRFEQAESDLNKCIKSGGKDLGIFLYLRGVSRYSLKKFDEACFDWQQSANLGVTKGEKKLSEYCITKD